MHTLEDYKKLKHELLITKLYKSSSTKELQEKVARAFAEQVYTWKGAKENFFAILMSGSSWLDWSLFQCFYVEQGKNGIHISNSLSGEAYNYCIRKFVLSR